MFAPVLIHYFFPDKFVLGPQNDTKKIVADSAKN